MCLLIFKPKNTGINPKYLEQGFKNNPDGAGIGYIKEGKIYLEKGFFTFVDFLEAYERNIEFEMMIHFRFATTGVICSRNTHPFLLGDSCLGAHNGIFSGYGNDSMTDSEHFLRNNVNPHAIHEKTHLEELEKLVGASSKVILMDCNGSEIINQKGGIWEDGVWFSNDSYLPSHFGLNWDRSYEYPSIKSEENIIEKIEEIISLIDNLSDVSDSAISKQLNKATNILYDAMIDVENSSALNYIDYSNID